YIQENGVSSEDDYQYFGKREKWCTNGGTELGKVFVQRVVRIPRNETLMMHYLAEVGPMTTEVPIIEPLRHYKEGVFHPSEALCAEAPSRTQTMTVVGYGTQNGKNYWILKNSWGETWGMNGYIYYERGVESCGIEEGDLFGVEVRKVPGVEAANKRSDCHDHCN
ncbi:unnamed protein product, partial [Anisakis simplex]|uniref:Pept_C1 domain-containing protein n=1 Tax=Anisakis simplex TaxID=6269 RepID=A0A0M3JBC4_ANISI